MAATPQKPPESARALGAGLTFAATVALFALGGLWLDGKLATSPLFVLVGTLFGILGGTIHLLRVLAPGVLRFGSHPRSEPPRRTQHGANDDSATRRREAAEDSSPSDDPDPGDDRSA
jgi:hypothetical protein